LLLPLRVAARGASIGLGGGKCQVEWDAPAVSA